MGVNRFIFVGRKNNYHTVMRAEGERSEDVLVLDEKQNRVLVQ